MGVLFVARPVLFVFYPDRPAFVAEAHLSPDDRSIRMTLAPEGKFPVVTTDALVLRKPLSVEELLALYVPDNPPVPIVNLPVKADPPFR